MSDTTERRGNPPLNLPSPDPSTLTTNQLHEAISNLRSVFETRLNAMDKASEVLSENVNRVPTLLDRQIQQIKELHGEKFASVEKQLAGMISGIALQFEERDVRSKASETSASIAVAAALQAQKEAAAAQNDANAAAITKSEASTVKQLDGIMALLASNTKAIDEKIASINGRLDRGEGANTGGRDTREESRSNIGMILAVIGAIVGVVGFVVGLVGVVSAISHNSTGIAALSSVPVRPEAVYIQPPAPPLGVPRP